MTKKTRTVLFLICLVLFLLIAPAAVFYSMGYRINFETKRITQTGGLFLKVLPRQAEVFIDGKLKKKTDFFSGSILIENLLPKKYTVEIKKRGYHSWQKTLEIKEREVTEAKNIVLIPENLDFTILAKGIADFYFFPDEKGVILKELNENGWVLNFYDLEKNIKNYLVDEYSLISTSRYAQLTNKKDIYQKDINLLNLSFSENLKEIYLEIKMREQIKYFTLKLDQIPPVLTVKETPTIPKNIIIYQKVNNDIYYLDNSGYIFKADLAFTPREKINEISFPLQQETEYKLEIFPNYFFLREGQILYLFNRDSKSFEKFFEPIKNLKISPDFKKIVYFSNYEIWVLFLESDPQTFHQKKDRVFLTRFSEKIDDVFWYTPHYLLFNTGDEIKIAEIDDRDKINIVDLAEFKNPKIFWSQTQKKLYILSQGNLFVSENLQK